MVAAATGPFISGARLVKLKSRAKRFNQVTLRKDNMKTILIVLIAIGFANKLVNLKPIAKNAPKWSEIAD